MEFNTNHENKIIIIIITYFVDNTRLLFIEDLFRCSF